MKPLKVTSIGNSLGIALPKAILEKLKIQKGDSLYPIETPNGLELTPYDPTFAKQMEIAEAIMKEDRDVLRKLAK
ncbi:hypothetical protein JYU14_00365 [Simkania negevensis]|uniref:SpoVT-AbrB domain-containing protein n=1 Tax=Simkania negevensis TaxID=83561 RepID=A0ABS3AQC0_9BACT|nr:hypothetical protein [Simkania negevensis]